MYFSLPFILSLAISCLATNSTDDTNVEDDFKSQLDNLANKIQLIINSENKMQLNEIISDESNNELLQKIGKWFENGDITPIKLINLATLSFAGTFDSSPQLNRCMGKYTVCSIKHCSSYSKKFDSYDPEIFQCLGKCVPKFISCLAWAGENPILSEL